MFAPPSRETLRLFVALFPPPEVVGAADAAFEPLRRELEASAIRWTAPEQIHLTLNFIGPATRERAGAFSDAIAAAAARHAAFEIVAAGAGVFPDARRPRVIWAGLAGQTDYLGALKKDLDGALAPLGFKPEERPFHPHLTFGRVNGLSPREREALGGHLVRLGGTRFGVWRAREIRLMRSVLLPQGAQYSVLESFGLKERCGGVSKPGQIV